MSAWYLWPLWAALGAFGWTFSEYAMHRWWGHEGRGRNEFSREHLHHHADTRYFASAKAKAKAALLLLGVVLPVLGWALGWSGVALAVGYIAMYLTYEVIHRRIHTHPPAHRYGRWVRRHHYFHHFSGPRFNHGVTTPLWDHVFGTLRDPGVIRVPRKHVMVWLLDPATGEVRADLAQDYALAKRGEPFAHEQGEVHAVPQEA